jgi:hypothetical protein
MFLARLEVNFFSLLIWRNFANNECTAPLIHLSPVLSLIKSPFVAQSIPPLGRNHFDQCIPPLITFSRSCLLLNPPSLLKVPPYHLSQLDRGDLPQRLIKSFRCSNGVSPKVKAVEFGSNIHSRVRILALQFSSVTFSFSPFQPRRGYTPF